MLFKSFHAQILVRSQKIIAKLPEDDGFDPDDFVDAPVSQ
jgi:hypothetical protein